VGTFDAREFIAFEDQPGAVHLGGHFEDPDHLYLASCVSETGCSMMGHPGNAITTLFESFDRATTWHAVGARDGLFTVRGRTSQGELLIDQLWPTGATFLFPSEVHLDRPLEAIERKPPFVIGGVVAWEAPGAQLLDEDGLLVADLSNAVPAGGEIWWFHESADGAYLVNWRRDGRSWGSAVIQAGDIHVIPRNPWEQSPAIWLDSGTLIAGVQYPREWLAKIDSEQFWLSNVPSFVDLDTRTLHPILEFLAPDAPQGRNTIKAVWQD